MTKILTLVFGKQTEAHQVVSYLRDRSILSEMRTVSRGNTHIRVHVPDNISAPKIASQIAGCGYKFTSFVVEEETPVATDNLTPDCLIVTKLDNGWQVERVKSIGTDKGRSTICTTCGGNVGKAIVENTLVLLQALAIEPVPVHYVGV